MTTIDTQISSVTFRRQRQVSLHGLVTAGLANLGKMMIAVIDWQYRARERRQLLGLSDRALQDFGASRADAAAESDKPFWRA